ncbi:LytR/AlgR family response regulator transcription factor [Pseudoalteromonas sp. T1lg88]|uniref:LytR/AlgR family response regulator transcription factor n=1 Tax=Pseudoalteromonas sp. T1lg88 TaxID=2077104 RepID=UPI000CF5F17A|nr:LytTR family DNA-binding domain-containing protein [Pseudoalteromonas sp. T1lg88]
MQVLIVDDEPMAQKRLNRLLAEHAHIDVIGYANNGVEAVELAAQLQPDVIFIDVEMPGKNGLSAAQEINEQAIPPAIVFVTAHPQHALDAFKVMPAAYLLKPLERQELDIVVNKLSQLNKAQVKGQQQQSISYKVGHQTKKLNLSDIIYCCSDGKYTQAICHDTQVLLDTSLKELEQQYPRVFLRIHRNTLVNKEQLQSVVQQDKQYQVRLKSCEDLLSVSRREVTRVKEALTE